MAGWSSEKREKVELAFYQYLNRCYVNSRDGGRICLGEAIYEGQRRVITEIFDGLEEDIHTFVILKSRQLGISTIIRALIVFLLGIFNGLKGAIVFDTDNNKVESRSELEVMIEELPRSLKFPLIKTSNRSGLMLSNNSKVLFMSAGIKKSKSSGTLGRSVGLSVAHGSELCSWDNEDGWEAFQASLSDNNPDRIYIWESTARGYNFWHKVCQEAKADSAHQKFIFIGWWSKDSQRIERSHPDFQLYGEQPPSAKERHKIDLVRQLYGVEITPEQLAWVRRNSDPSAQAEGDTPAEYEPSALRLQEQPWCVTANTRVGTSDGIIPISEVCGGNATLGKILHYGPTGKAAIWRARTKLGYQIEGTANHPLISTDEQEIRLDQSYGKKIKLQPPRFSEQKRVVTWREGIVDNSVVITPDFARLVGLYMGDGSIWGSSRSGWFVQITCCNEDMDIVDECERLFSGLFEKKTFRHVNTTGSTDVRVQSRLVVETFKKLGLTRDDTANTRRKIYVPEFIWRSPKHVVKEFLSGLFEADGFNAHNTNRVALFSKYPKFIADIQLLLLAFGITSRSVSMKKKHPDGHYYTGNQLELRTAEAIRFNKEIGFLSARKRGRFNEAAYEKMWTERLASPKKGNNKRPVIVLEDEIVSVEHTDRIEEVYNLTVDDTHWFDANGILTHNTEEDAWQQTGSVFFPQETLTEITNKDVSRKYAAWMFLAGAEFVDMKVIKAPNARNIDLKVWEEPDPDGIYAMGVDPAFGENPLNDRSSIEIFRCYADGLDQVAEYASPLINTRQLAWVIASLLGWYGGGPNALIKYGLELNGPGTATFNALKELRALIESGMQKQEIEERGLQNVFRNVRTYIYARSDSMNAGQSFHIKTTGPLKITFLERFRDFVTNGTCRLRSADLVDEMKNIAREGDTIAAPGTMKDDRVLGSSFAVHVWESGLRRMLMTQKRTREAEAARKRLSIVDQVALYNSNQLGNFFEQKRRVRVQQQRMAVRQTWRYR